MKIAFLGLGNMGGPMAANLRRDGYAVSGFDPSASAGEAAAKTGTVMKASPTEAARDAEIVITMLPSGRHLLDLYREILPACRPGTLFIDSSTIDVTDARAAQDLAAKAGMLAVDAPVSGGVGGAAAATLTFMVGGSDQAFAAAGPVLGAMGRSIVHCGAAGAGQAAKICNNMILGVSMIAVSEAFVLAEKLGLSADALYKVAANSSGQCWSLTMYCPVPGPVLSSPANRGYAAGFAAALMLKDLKLAQAAAQASGAATQLGQAAAEIYQRYVDGGDAATDFSGIINTIRSKSAAAHEPA